MATNGQDSSGIGGPRSFETTRWSVVRAAGEPELLTSVDSERGEMAHSWPELLPNHSVLFTVWSGSAEDARVAVLSLETGEVSHLLAGGSHARYSPTGHILYGVGGTLWAVGFDLGQREVVGGNPVPVLENVKTKGVSGAASFALSHDGSLVFVAGGATDGVPRRSLTWVDRQGREQPLGLPPRAYDWPRVSPDGRRAALSILDQENADVWILNLGAEALTRLTFDAAQDVRPIWTPDGQRVIFASRREGPAQLFAKAADGTGGVERLTQSEKEPVPHTISPDGRWLLVEERAFETGRGLALLSLEDGATQPLFPTGATERNAEISPDGEWIAYESKTSSRSGIYVQPFPNLGEGKWMVSGEGGTWPVWGPDGRELFFLDGVSRLMVVAMETNDGLRPGIPEILIDGQVTQATPGRPYDLSPDGRFLMIRDVDTVSAPSTGHQVVIVQ
ncbi:MAG: hypothetical protein CL477_16015 [Acidobacteria bacterium]|jgi:Tol biopolymer transport system component|nr:hypothetical protein [Acidobacteriota bacterium]HJN42857.1 hypothetical protein [Vicinamibacterales bacterium]